MFQLPTIPNWEAFHPIVVHYPVAILPLAPVAALVAVFWRAKRSEWLFASALLLLVGTASAQFAVLTGEVTWNSIDLPAELDAKVQAHHNAGLFTRTLAGAAALWTAGIWYAMRKRERVRRRGAWGVVATLPLQLLMLMQLTLAGDLGGRLVHEHHIVAPMNKSEPTAAPGVITPNDPQIDR